MHRLSAFVISAIFTLSASADNGVKSQGHFFLGGYDGVSLPAKWVQIDSETKDYKARYDAVKKKMPDALVIIRFDNGFDNDHFNSKLDSLQQEGAKWDIIGMSLYPHKAVETGQEQQVQKTIIDCIRNINRLWRKYQTPSAIIETGFEIDTLNPWKMQLGRAQLQSLIEKAQKETNGHCLGVFYSDPEGQHTEIMRAMALAAKMVDPSVEYDRPLVKIETTEGDIIVELYNETPIHRDNFLRLAKTGALEKTLFHRVIKNFMIQGGDPDSKTAPATSLEKPAAELGNSEVPTEKGEKSLEAEICYPLFFHKRGALASAREPDDKNPRLRSSSSQFYIVWGSSPAPAGKHPYEPKLAYYDYEKDAMYAKPDTTSSYQPQPAGTPWLDGGYTVFGEVVQGLDIVDKIQQVQTDKLDRPLKDIRIIKVKSLE